MQEVQGLVDIIWVADSSIARSGWEICVVFPAATVTETSAAHVLHGLSRAEVQHDEQLQHDSDQPHEAGIGLESVGARTLTTTSEPRAWPAEVRGES